MAGKLNFYKQCDDRCNDAAEVDFVFRKPAVSSEFERRRQYESREQSQRSSKPERRHPGCHQDNARSDQHRANSHDTDGITTSEGDCHQDGNPLWQGGALKPRLSRHRMSFAVGGLSVDLGNQPITIIEHRPSRLWEHALVKGEWSTTDDGNPEQQGAIHCQCQNVATGQGLCRSHGSIPQSACRYVPSSVPSLVGF